MRLPEKAVAWAEDMQRMLVSSHRVIAFTGAGISMAPPANVPGWRQCFLRLCDAAVELGKQEVADRTRAIAKLTGYEPHYLTVAFGELRLALGDVVYHREMQRILEPESRTAFPQPMLQLVRLPFWAYMTTSIDTLLEDASLEAHRMGARKAPLRPYVEAERVSHEVGSQNSGWLWKLHGTINHTSSWIFTADEYWRSIYATRYAAHRQLLENLAHGYHIVFVGFGGCDPEVDLHLNHVVEIFGGQQRHHYLLAREMAANQKLALARRNIDVVEYRGPSDHSGLTELLTLLGQETDFAVGDLHADSLGDFSVWTCAQTTTVDLRRIAGANWQVLAGRSISLNEVFVDLYEQVRPSNLLQAECGGASRAKRRVVDVVLDGEYRGLVLLGSGGSGKSTLLKRAAQCLLGMPSAPLPVYVRVPELMEIARKHIPTEPATGKARADTFLDAAESLLPDVVAESGDFRGWVTTQECTWLLDGLDELKAEDEQKWVFDALDAAIREWKSSRFVVTSRPLNTIGSHIPPIFEILTIDDLSDDDITALTEKWVNILLADHEVEERHKIVDQFVMAFDGDPGFRQLSRSPVMLTSMVLVQLTLGREQELPRAKSEVLRAVVTWLLESRQHRIGQQEIEPLQVERIYEDLALFMLHSGAGPDKGRVGIREAGQELANHFDGRAQDAVRFLISEQTVGLLDGKGRGDVIFSVPHFRDYLAASCLGHRPDDGEHSWWSTSKDHLLDTDWTETFGLLPACLAREGAQRAELFFHRVAQAVVGESLGQRAAAYSVAARACSALRGIALAAPSEGAWAELHRGMAELFTVEALVLPVRERVIAATAHGWVGDLRLASGTDLWVTVPPGDSVCGAQADSKDDENYDSLALPWETPVRRVRLDGFEIHRFPVIAAEFDEFVRAGGYRIRKFWSVDGWQWIQEGRITTPGSWYRQMEVPNSPATELSYFEASAYCRWLGYYDPDHIVRLPSSDEWEFVALRSTMHRQIASGSWDLGLGSASLVNWLGTELWGKVPVGIFARSTTDDGVVDMVGNVEEWCRDAWPEGLLDPEQERGFGVATKYGFHIVRGGSAIRAARLCRPTYFSRCRTEGRYPTIGFRPVRQTKAGVT